MASVALEVTAAADMPIARKGPRRHVAEKSGQQTNVRSIKTGEGCADPIDNNVECSFRTGWSRNATMYGASAGNAISKGPLRWNLRAAVCKLFCSPSACSPRPSASPSTPHPSKQKDRPKAVFLQESIIRLGRSKSCHTLAPAIRHQADPSKAQEHHCPRRRFGDRRLHTDGEAVPILRSWVCPRNGVERSEKHDSPVRFLP